MTLEEFLGRTKVTGRTLETHETTGFAFRGRIWKVEPWGILIRFFLADFARSYEAERGPWKNLPNSDLPLGKNTPIETAEDGTISFSLPNDGGRGYILPKAKKQKGAENA